MSDDKDLEKCTGGQVSLSCEASRQCAIAVQHSDGRALLINATIKEEEVTGYLNLSSAKQISQALTKGWHQRLTEKLFMHFVVGTARIKQISHCAQRPHCSPGHHRPPISPPRVYLQDFTLDPLLTEALHDPRILVCPTDHTLDKLCSPPAVTNRALGYQTTQTFSNDIDKEPTSTCIEHENHDVDVIVIRRLLDRAKVARLLILLLFLSPALGIGFGVCFQNADVGIAVSAGWFALTTFVQGLVAWVQG